MDEPKTNVPSMVYYKRFMGTLAGKLIVLQPLELAFLVAKMCPPMPSDMRACISRLSDEELDLVVRCAKATLMTEAERREGNL
jgi:hypothetical protein